MVEDIYEIVSRQDAHRISQNPDAKGTLIVLCGDHGMNEVNGLLCIRCPSCTNISYSKDGNHGGSSIGETSAVSHLLGGSW